VQVLGQNILLNYLTTRNRKSYCQTTLEKPAGRRRVGFDATVAQPAAQLSDNLPFNLAIFR